MCPRPPADRPPIALPPRGEPTTDDLLTAYAQHHGISVDQAVEHLAKLAGLLDEPADET
jgi:hypothetical protein